MTKDKSTSSFAQNTIVKSVKKRCKSLTRNNKANENSTNNKELNIIANIKSENKSTPDLTSLDQEVQEVTDIISQNVQLLENRGDFLDNLQQRSTILASNSLMFAQQSEIIKKKNVPNLSKYIITGITTIAAIITAIYFIKTGIELQKNNLIIIGAICAGIAIFASITACLFISETLTISSISEFIKSKLSLNNVTQLESKQKLAFE